MTGFGGLITSKARAGIIMRLFLNPRKGANQRQLASELGCSSSQISDQLRQLAQAGFLTGTRIGRQQQWRANADHPMFPELQSMVRKAMGMDRILDSILRRLGHLELALVLDDYAEGKDTGIIDLLLVGDIDEQNLLDLVRKTEAHIHRKIRTLCLSRNEYEELAPRLEARAQLPLWRLGEPLAGDGTPAGPRTDARARQASAPDADAVP